MRTIKNRERLACLGVIFVNICWGLSFIGSKKAMNAGFLPFSLVTVRFLVSSAVLLPVALLKKVSLRMAKKDITILILASLSGVTVYFFFELNGLKHTSAATASLIIAAIPALTMLVSVVVHKKKLSLLSWAGAIVSLIGVYMVVASDGSADTVKGAMYMFGACGCWVTYMELSNILLKKYSSLCVTLWQSVVSLISLVPLCFTEDVAWSGVGLEAWLWASVFLGFICSALCYILYNHSISVLAPVRTAIFLNLNPIAAVVGGMILLGEKLVLKQYIGGVIILVSLYLVTRFGDKKAKEAQKNV